VHAAAAHARSTIAVLRCVSSTMVWEACGRNLLAPPLLAMMAHLCIGDTWNTINNVEGRCAVGVLYCVAMRCAALLCNVLRRHLEHHQ
jgi:tryptophan-rich sensory protein